MSLDPNQLKQEAVETAKLSNFGDAPMDEGLERFCWSLVNEVKPNAPRQAAAEALIRKTLVERLKIEDCLSRNPEILKEKVVKPLFVFSLPRTGSTATSQFLSEDPDARSIRRWECESVTPPPDASIKEDPRIAPRRAAFERQYREQPELRGMLPVDAEDPSEHGPILGLTFQNLQWPSLWTVPSFTRWMIDSDLKPSYEYLHKVLKILQWKTPASHWNLKNPPDIFAVDAIASVFPDARLVWTHRDPAKSVPSVCSLTSLIRKMMGEDVDRRAIGELQIQFQSEGARLASAVDGRFPEGRIVHVYQRDLGQDTVATIAKMYREVGLDFSDAYRAHLERRIAIREKPSHSYTMEDYGLTVPMIRAQFKAYTDKYNVPLEL